MRTLPIVLMFVGVLFLGAGCGAAGTTTPALPVPAPSIELTEDYDDALSIRNQLAYGTLRLEETADALTAEQASRMIPLWQALSALDAASTSSTAETAAVQEQLLSAMSPSQKSAIAAMRLTNAMLQTYYIESGIAEVRTPEPGVTPQSSSLKDLPPEQREAAKATAQALGTPVGGGSGGSTTRKDALTDAVMALLAERASDS